MIDKTGYLLYCPHGHWLFREYINGKSKDYIIKVEDLKIHIIDNYSKIEGDEIIYNKTERNNIAPTRNDV